MWKVSLGFDCEEETINFGARQTAVYEQTVYETSTIATICKSQQNTDKKDYHVRCMKFDGSNPGILIIIDETIIVVNNEGNKLRRNFSFPATVDCYAIGSDVNIYVALSNGDLYYFMLDTCDDPVFLKNVCNPNIQDQKTFICMFLHEFEKNCDVRVILVTSSGNIYKIKALNLIVTNEDRGSMKDEINGSACEYITINRAEYELCKVISAIELRRMDEQYMLLIVQNQDAQTLQLWSEDCNLEDITPIPHEYSLKNIQTTKNGSLLYGITKQSTLMIICPYTLTLLQHRDEIMIEQLEIMTSENFCNMLILTKDESQFSVQSMETSGSKMKFHMSFKYNCRLAENQSALEDLVYIEMFSSAEEENSFNIHLKIMSESQPEDRLERILRRGKFEEAEKFARVFNLNIESVHKSHLVKICADIQPWVTGNTLIEENKNLFKELLHKIEDTEFVARCALNMISSDFDLMKDTLRHSESRIKYQISIKDKDNTVLQNLYNKTRNLLLRLETFCAISEKPLLIDQWLSFQKTNLIDECLNSLNQGKTKEVTIIWGRHVHELKVQLSFEQAISFFNVIPPTMPVNKILNWFHIFLPTIFGRFPRITRNLIVWAKDKVKIMELLEEENWIENGLKFLKDILKMTRKYMKMNIIESEFASDSPIQSILFHIRILTELSIMKKDYKINLSILEYTETEDHDLMFTILDKVPQEELKSFINGFFQQLNSKKNLNLDTIVAEYIKCLVEGSVDWWYWEEAPWESRAAVLLDCVDGIQEKLNSVLIILKNSPVPWSPVITSICSQALKYDNVLTKLIHEQKRMVDCKLILKKYDLKDIKILQSDFERVLFYIFKQNRENMLEHALLIANTFDSNLHKNVYKFYIKHLVENKNVEDALYFLDEHNLPPEMIITCCECVIHQASCLRDHPASNDRCNKYAAILDAVRSRLIKTKVKLDTCSEGTLMDVSSDLCDPLKKLNYLKKHFAGLELNYFYSCRKKNEDLLSDCLVNILESSVAEQKFLENMNMKLFELAKCFSLSGKEILSHFLRLTMMRDEPKLVIHVLKSLLKLEHDKRAVADEFIDTASFVLTTCIRKTEYICETDIASLTHQLTTNALNSCSSDVINKGLEIGIWFSLLQKSSVVINDNIAVQSYGQVSNSSIINLLPLYGSSLAEVSLKSRVAYLNTEFKKASEHQTNLLEALKNIIEQENEFVSFRIVTVLHWFVLNMCVTVNRDFCDCSIVSQLKHLSFVCLTRLLNKLIGSRHLDTLIGSAVLHHFKKEDATKWIVDSTKRYKFDFQRLYTLTELGLVYFEQSHCAEDWNSTCALRKRCVWGKQVMEYGISYKEAFRESLQERKQLLKKLMSLPMVNSSILERYCRDMDFDFQACLKVYLRQSLVSWEPDFDVKADQITGEKEILVKNSQMKLLNKCRDIVNIIENRKEIFELLSSSIWDSINYYYYEVYLVLLALMEEFATTSSTGLFSTYRNVFIFLSSYHRISGPKDYEKDQWYMIYQSAQFLPPIAEYRLPFRLIFPRWTKSNNDPWKIIRPELNIRTYSKWFTILDALELDKNLLCTFAINQMTTERTSQNNAKSEWCVHLRHQELLSDVQKCIEHITSLEMVTASLYFVMNHLPPGADQLTAAKLCFLHSKNWYEEEKSEKSKAGFVKCQKKYLTVSTTHVLYCHNLGKPQYVQLVLSPSELIVALYNDPIILQWNSGDSLDFPDINKAAEEIGVLHREDVFKIRLNLLEEWLLPEDFMADVSYDGNILKSDTDKNVKKKFSDADHNNFIRACYVVQRGIKSFGLYLTNIALDRNIEDSKPISIRLRALHCLLSVTTSDSLQEVIGCSSEELKNYMVTLQFISELEVLGLTYSLEAFTLYNKTEIARSLLSLKTSNAANLAANICLRFNITAPFIWNDILVILCSFGMIRELTDILPELTNIYHTLDFPIFEECWNLVILTPLESAPELLSEDEKEKLVDVVKLIFLCPIADETKLKWIRENCVRIGIGHLIEDIDNITF